MRCVLVRCYLSTGLTMIAREGQVMASFEITGDFSIMAHRPIKIFPCFFT